jgi:hypothetical protein
LKSIVSIGGKFMTGWQSWWVLAWCAQPIKGQFLRESRRWMICPTPSWWIEQHHTWKNGQAWEQLRAVIIVDSPRWALHLHLSGRLAHE